jgi:hypothetical protein
MWLNVSKQPVNNDDSDLFIYGLFNDAVSSSDNRMIHEYWIGMDMKGSGRGLNQGTIPAFFWKDWWKPRKTSVRLDGYRTEISTQDLPNTKQEC